MDKTHCIGCDSNFYNGNNDLGVKKCWHLENAKLVTRYSIGWWTPQDKKENFEKVRVPECFSNYGDCAYYDELPAHLRKE